MSEPAAVEPVQRHVEPAVVLVLLWLAWVVSAVVCAPRADLDARQLREDLQQHRVTAFTTVEEPPDSPVVMLLRPRAQDTAAGHLVWQVEGQKRRYTDFPAAIPVLDEFREYAVAADASQLSVVQGGMIDASDIHDVGMGAPSAYAALGWLVPLAALACLLVIPLRTGTGWFWFWIMGMPGGAGVLSFVLVELLRKGPVREHRHVGPHGFLAALLVNGVTSILVSLV